MKIRVLGSSAGGGFPQWNCNCPNCSGLRRGTIRAQARTQSSIAVSDDGGSWVLFNASPDILQQLREFPALQPARALRDTAIGGVVLIDAQIDHTTGLLMLREHRRALDLWCTEPVHDDLTGSHPLFNLLGHYCGVAWHPLPLDAAVEIPACPGLRFQALPLASNAPPYSPYRDRPRRGDNIGVRIVDTARGGSVFYAPGLERIEEHVWSAMRESSAVLVDGTFWNDDELIRLGVSARHGHEMGHLAQNGRGGMIEWLDRLPPAVRRVLIHINNTNPILDEDSAERAILAQHRIEVAFDGMEITL